MLRRMLSTVVLGAADSCSRSHSTCWVTARRQLLKRAHRGGLLADTH